MPPGPNPVAPIPPPWRPYCANTPLRCLHRPSDTFAHHYSSLTHPSNQFFGQVTS